MSAFMRYEQFFRVVLQNPGATKASCLIVYVSLVRRNQLISAEPREHTPELDGKFSEYWLKRVHAVFFHHRDFSAKPFNGNRNSGFYTSRVIH